MTSPTTLKKAPAFKLPSTSGKAISLKELEGHNVVLYFYPRDNTPGCTTESKDFSDRVDDFTQANTVILGISQDSIKSHEKFLTKLGLPFHLLSDEDGTVCTKYDVIKLKKMYGKEFYGIERSTFLIDAKGVLQHQWRKVRVPGHVDEVLASARELAGV